MSKQRFTPNQLRILRSLDGATAPVQFDGIDKRSLVKLRDLGLVTFREGRKSAKTYYYPNATTMVLTAALTKDGFNFIYDGGIDR